MGGRGGILPDEPSMTAQESEVPARDSSTSKPNRPFRRHRGPRKPDNNGSSPKVLKNGFPQANGELRSPQSNEDKGESTMDGSAPKKKFRPRGRRPQKADQGDRKPQPNTQSGSVPKEKSCEGTSNSEKGSGTPGTPCSDGAIRINQRKYEEAFINNPEGSDQTDIAVLGMPDRNRALHGDIVAVRIRPRACWVVNEELYKSWKQSSCAAVANSSSNKVSGDAQNVSSAVRNDPPNASSGTLPDDNCSRLVEKEDETCDVPDIVLKSVEEQVFEVMETLTTSVVLEQGQLQEMETGCTGVVASSTTPLRSNGDKTKTVKRKTYRVLSDLPLEDWMLPDSCLQKTAEVVAIVEKKNSRLATGKLELATSTQRQWAKFSPSDSRIPRMMINASQLPNDFFNRPQDFAKFLFVAKIAEWPENSLMAHGNLEKQLGLAGEIDVETEGLLITHEIDTREFSDEVIACLPSVSSESGWQIDQVQFLSDFFFAVAIVINSCETLKLQEELAKRRDLRDEIIFTIDPKTARDLDDALSIKPCDDVDGAGKPGWEVGVHIADVSHFVYENTVLDEWASKRANSVYLVHQVVPMLPRLLCEELCSLNAGVDRLTFSVIFKMDDEGNVYDEWFGRSVIRSRVKLTYEHAQDFIENPDKEFSEAEVSEISDGTTVYQIKEKVLQLHSVAKALRAKRSQSGSLQLDQPKLKFALDDETKMPIGVSIYQAKDSNRLVEEFMLLANMAVARKIERHYRKTALLRMHPPPKAKILREAVLSMILMKAMELARYFCTGSVESQSCYHHFALNVPFYTHFTSPIRRYPDIIVHRLLAASLNYCEPSQRTVEEIQKIVGFSLSQLAEHCNDKKLTAKKVSEASAETFFGILIQRVGPMEAKGVVVNVLDAAFDVLLFKYGVIKRVYVNALEMSQEPLFRENPNRLSLYWNTDAGRIEQLIQMCTVVDVVLTGLPEPTKFQAVIKPRPSNESPTLMEMWRERQSHGGTFFVSNMSRRGDYEAKVYIGGLPHDATSQEIEDAFHRFGRIRKVWVARRPPGFAFVEFEDTRDAEDAVKSLDGARICGVRARVELSHGKRNVSLSQPLSTTTWVAVAFSRRQKEQQQKPQPFTVKKTCNKNV
ncbi:RNB-like protein [Ancylostoma ceylanicum]|uniref:RNB-like protein n=3 Tax=Ancylostoma TaxID=29169 RepID=A0A0D6M139_9BILA|nr:RNB-like protein [Ancylostoma ceylanicum]